MTNHVGRSRICAVVPVKNLAAAKQRLSPKLKLRERRKLSLAMLSDVITTLKRVDGLETVAVLSSDPDAIKLARALRVRVLRDTGAHLNTALSEAAQLLEEEGYGTMLVVPGDVPLATPPEFEKILAEHERGRSVTLVPDLRRTGTNTLACSLPIAITPCFGKRSFVLHQEAAQNAGLIVSILELPGLGLDIDVPDDLHALTSQPRQSRTHAFLSELLDGAQPNRTRQPEVASGGRSSDQYKSR